MTRPKILRKSPAGSPLRLSGLALLSTFLLAGCGDSLGVDGPGNVTVSFQASESQQASAGSPQMGSPGPAPVTYEGNNGTLVLDRVLMIVSEMELEHEDGCDDDDGFGDQFFDDCEDFEADPQLIDLPLDGTPISVYSALIAPGVYDELEFEVEDLDDEDDHKRGVLENLRGEILAIVPDWPREASLYVEGTFQPVGGDPVPFRTFVEAEIEVELELDPYLVIGDDGVANRDLLVDVRPDLWFRDFQGGVRDMREWDYDTTGRILELEVEIEDGFIEVEFDD
jgi:hypothetical protein